LRPAPRGPAAATGKVRVIGGTLRGSRLPVVDLPGLRPTPDRVRVTLFNWLAPVLPGARVLDLYAGTGALGIEAASRGAAEVVLVERNPVAARSLFEQVRRLGIEATTGVRTDAALRYLAGTPTAFDIVFLDPPFEDAAWESSARALSDGGWLSPGALVYVELPRGTEPAMPVHWQRHRESAAGEVRYILYRSEASPELSSPHPVR